MTRTILSIRFVFILAAVIGIHGQDTPREAALTIISNFEDGQSDREFRVDFVGVKDSKPATIKIFKEGDSTPQVEHTIKEETDKARTLYFKLKEAEAGSYQVQVCLSDTNCSEKRTALGNVLEENQKPKLSCIKGTGLEENVFHEFVNKAKEEFKINIIPGNDFMESKDYDSLPQEVKDASAYVNLNLDSNPAYKTTVDGKTVFYAGVLYNGAHLKDLLDTAVSDKQIEYFKNTYGVTRKSFSDKHTHAYCTRKYIFWASAHVMNVGEKLVLRRFRGTILPNEAIVNSYILKDGASPIPVEFVREDEEQVKLPVGTYDVAVSFCATDKDSINSSVCSKAVYSTLTIKA